MAISGKFLADFESFYSACQKAEVSLQSFETGGAKVEKSLNRLSNAFTGQRTIQDATLMTEAIARVGGATTLTAAEQARVNRLVSEAIEKYKALGQQAPPAILALAEATRRIEPPVTAADKAMGLLKSSFGQFTAANLATTAITAVVSELQALVALGAKLPGLQNSFGSLARGLGQDSQAMLSAMSAATKGLVADFDLMQSANKAMLLGLPVTTQTMGDLAKTATVLGRAMGIDATKALDDLITALGRSSPMILDNLGLTVKVAEANDAYAKKLHTTADALTPTQQKMAFYEAAMEAARAKTKELGDQTLTLSERVSSAWTSIGNVITTTTGSINEGMGLVMSNGKAFLVFLENAKNFGFGAALGLSGTVAQLSAPHAPHADVNLSLPTNPLDEYRKHLDQVTASVTKLSAEEQALIVRGTAIGENAKEIATALQNVSQAEVEAFLATKKARDEAIAAAASVAKAWKDMWFDAKMIAVRTIKEQTDELLKEFARQRDAAYQAQKDLLALVTGQRARLAAAAGTGPTPDEALAAKHEATVRDITFKGAAAGPGFGSATQEALANEFQEFQSAFDAETKRLNDAMATMFSTTLPAAVTAPELPNAAKVAAESMGGPFIATFNRISQSADAAMAHVTSVIGALVQTDAYKAITGVIAPGFGTAERINRESLTNIGLTRPGIGTGGLGGGINLTINAQGGNYDTPAGQQQFYQKVSGAVETALKRAGVRF